jgi:hypothetical protein
LLRGPANFAPEGILFLYGPYRHCGTHTAPSNESFDAELRATNPAWGARDLDAVVELAGNAGLALVETVEMPTNNLSIIFQK